MDAEIGHGLGDLHEGATILLFGRRIHDDKGLAADGRHPEVTPKAGIGRGWGDGELPQIEGLPQPAFDQIEPCVTQAETSFALARPERANVHCRRSSMMR